MVKRIRSALHDMGNIKIVKKEKQEIILSQIGEAFKKYNEENNTNIPLVNYGKR